VPAPTVARGIYEYLGIRENAAPSNVHFSPERACVEGQSQPSRAIQALRLVEDDTAAPRHNAIVLSLR
jgi:hypothetical protein